MAARSPNGRFAPSPSADLHLGNLRTALLAWLYARAQGARFFMRVDDLDRGRSRPEIADRQLADLDALGLDWDEPVVYQSQRAARYDEALEALRDCGPRLPLLVHARRDPRRGAGAARRGGRRRLSGHLRGA